MARVPELVARDGLREGTLQRLFSPEPAAQVYLVTPSRTLLPAKVRVFLDVAGRQAASVFGCWSADGQLGPQKGDDFRWMAWVRS